MLDLECDDTCLTFIPNNPIYIYVYIYMYIYMYMYMFLNQMFESLSGNSWEIVVDRKCTSYPCPCHPGKEVVWKHMFSEGDPCF